ncbi:MAG: hypothetical protein R3C01_07645 [Planctomycetaceae bacterium]
MPIARISHLIVLLTLGAFVSTATPLALAAPPGLPPNRVQTGIQSSQGLKDDLKYLVVTLGENPKAWEDIELAVDAFLPGVDLTKPVGLDLVFDPTTGKRKVLHVPIENSRDFFNNNLNPIGILSRRRSAGFYHLDGIAALGWEGWMRTPTGSPYGTISEVADDIPTSLPVQDARLLALFAPGYDSVAKIEGTAGDMTDRQNGVRKLRDNLLAGIKRRPDESVEEFDLRRLAGRQQMDRLERVFVNAELMMAGWTTDTTRQLGHGDVAFTALAGTDLQKTLLTAGTTPSYFGAIPEAKSVVFLSRLNVPIDEFTRGQFEEFYGSLRPVLKKRLAESEKGTAAQKEARQRIADQTLDMLLGTLKLGVADLFVQTVPTTNGKNVIVAGVRSHDGQQVLSILREIPNAVTGWKLEEAVETVGTVNIHRLDISADIPDAIESFYGKSGEVFVGTSPEAVWFAGGEGALASLKATIQQVADGSPVADGMVARTKLRLGPVSRHIRDLSVEEGFSLSEFLGKVREGRQPREQTEPGREKRSGGALSGIDWDSELREALKNVNDDLVESTIWVQGGKLTGKTEVEKGVLIGIGRIIGNIAGDLLGG